MNLPLDPQLSYGMTEKDLLLDPHTIEEAVDLDVFDMVTEAQVLTHDPDAPARVMNMALATFLHLVTDADNAFDGLGYNDIFAACIHTALIWEVG